MFKKDVGVTPYDKYLWIDYVTLSRDIATMLGVHFFFKHKWYKPVVGSQNNIAAFY